MRGGHRWWWRIGLALLIWVATMAVTVALRDDPDPFRVALVVAVVVAAGSVLLDATAVSTPAWPVDPVPTTGLVRADPRTAAHLHLLEGHLTAAEPDGAVRDRLRDLADQALRSRHELSVHDPRAGPVLGPELRAVLEDAPRRLTPAVLERLVRRIEDL